MKKLLSLLLFYAAIISFSSCIKTVDAVPPQPVTDPLAGSWYLYDASENSNGSWYSFDPGIYGVLTFYNNSNAQYDDGNVLLQGDWSTNYTSDGYYDEYGNYYTDEHEGFQCSFTGSGNNSLYLYFDDISFAGNNQFTGTYYTGKSVERYTFKRSY